MMYRQVDGLKTELHLKNPLLIIVLGKDAKHLEYNMTHKFWSEDPVT